MKTRLTDDQIKEIIIARRIAEKEAKEDELVRCLGQLTAGVFIVWACFVAFLYMI